MADSTVVIPVHGSPGPAGTPVPNRISQAEKSVEFLGQELSASEYREACDNLSAFFATLRTWAENEKEDEEKA